MRTEEITRAQLRAARALARLDQKDVARAAGVSDNTVSLLESGAGEEVAAQTRTLRAVVAVFENSGIRFIEGGVIRQRDRGEPTDAALMTASPTTT